MLIPTLKPHSGSKPRYHLPSFLHQTPPWASRDRLEDKVTHHSPPGHKAGSAGLPGIENVREEMAANQWTEPPARCLADPPPSPAVRRASTPPTAGPNCKHQLTPTLRSKTSWGSKFSLKNKSSSAHSSSSPGPR